MSQETKYLSLPLLAAGQSQKHVTHNDALTLLDALVQLSVIDNNRTEPPTGPTAGDRHLIAAAPTNTWTGQSGNIACWLDEGWSFLVPQTGWLVWVQSQQSTLVFDGVAWQNLKVRAADQFGIGTTPDTTNRLAVASPASLFNHAGAGHQMKLNKAAAVDTASLLFQTNFSGRAEMGLAGNDDWQMKVSVDGTSWKNAMMVDRATGGVRFPNGMLDVSTGLRPAMLLPAPVKDIWRSDMDAPATPRTYTIAAVAGTAVTIITNEVEQFFNATMQNASMVRIWNMSKSPAQAAWVDWNLAINQFRVKDAASVSGWLAGETLRIGDPNPIGSNTLQMVAIDISNYLFNTFGTVFRQRGLKLSFGVQGTGGRVTMDCSGSGALGSAFGVISGTDGNRQSAFVDVFTTELSPVSNSNLLFIRESLAGGFAMSATRLMRLAGVWV